MASSSSTSSTLCDKDREDSAASLLEVEAGREATEGGIPLMSGPEAVRQWSRDLAKFADLNWKAHVGIRTCLVITESKLLFSIYFLFFQDTSFQDGIEDLNLRLEEFEHLLEMTSSDSSKCLLKQMPLIVAKYEQMETVFDKIDKYEVDQF